MTTRKMLYASSAAIFGSTDLDGLAHDATLLSGRQSAIIDNTSNLYTDALVSGRFKANNSAPTAGQILVFVGSILEDTPSYPDVFGATSALKTVNSTGIRNSVLRLLAGIDTDTTANRIYEFSPRSVAEQFGFIMPKKWFLFVTHSMVTALNTTASNGGQCWYSGVQDQSV